MCKKFLAEAIGTMVLVLMGCGAAVFNNCGIDTASVFATAVAFGLSVVAMAYTIGGVSGCHINPAITLAVWMSGRMSGKEAGTYMIAQVVGAFVGSAILFAITQSMTGFTSGTYTGANNVADDQLVAALIAEVVFTFIFVLVVLGTTDAKLGSPKLAGLAIGLTLILVHIVCIPITGTSVNPARSIAPAIFQGGTALANLWVFIVAPFLGAALSAVVWKALETKE
ncbi:MAG: MIP family channel protein [Rikenellaceae bacterium]